MVDLAISAVQGNLPSFTHVRMIVMKRFGSWFLVSSLLLALAACDEADSTSQSDQSETLGSGEGAALLQDLNSRLKPPQQCSDDAPYLAADYAERIPNSDTAACRFKNASSLVVFVVRSGKKTYERYFEGQRGPSYFLYGRDWFIVAGIGTPQRVLDILREEFGATG